MSRPTVHLICNAHLDPVWQWRWEEGCAEALATFRTAAALLGERPGWVFTHNEAVLYRWVEEHDPELFAEIVRLVAAGRWEIGGGWFLQPDLNLPGLESLYRHVREGRRWFRERFGAEPRVAYNFDAFGHGGGLPQLLRQCGYELYVHMRPQAPELELPDHLYRWRGVDGSEILALRIPVGLYHTERDNIERRLEEGVELALARGRDVPVFWGLGDHGGGATREDLDRIAGFIAREERVRVAHSTLDALLAALRGPGREAPVVAGELQRAFTGCYTSLARLKRRAREGLGLLVQAEALRAATWWALGQEYPEEGLDQAWWGQLFNDFHDILPGSCVEPAERDALDLYGLAGWQARRARLGAAAALSRVVTPPASIPLMVLSCNPGAGPQPVEAEFMSDVRPLWEGVWHFRLLRPDGGEVPCQTEAPEALLPFQEWRRKVVFLDDLPGLGAAGYRLEAAAGPDPRPPAPAALAHRLDPETGLVAGLQAAGRELLAGPLLQPLIVEDGGDSWGTGQWSWRREAGRFAAAAGSHRTLHAGPVRTLRQTRLEGGRSRIVLETSAYTGWPVLELRLRIHWAEEHRRLKLAVPTALKGAELLAEVAGGALVRPADGEEHVHGRWLLIHQGGAALGIVNGGQHGFDWREGELRLSVLRSAAYCHERGLVLGGGPARKLMDQGIHEARLLVTAGGLEEVRARLPVLAAWLDAPPFALAHLPGLAAPGGPGRWELLRLEPPTVGLLACRPAADRRALILRIQETAGRPVDAILRISKPAGVHRVALPAFGVRTLRLERDGALRQVDPVAEA